MKTNYKYIHFVKVADKPKTTVWECMNSKHSEKLGIIKWYAPWRQYCYFSTVQAVYNIGCLNDITDFIASLNVIKR